LNVCIEAASWRWPTYLSSIFVSLAFILIEFSLNRIELDPFHVVFPILTAIAYLGTTFVGQYLYSAPIYPGLLDWDIETLDSDSQI
jgi:multidrug transporter EmrE-like cation transporter